MAEVSNAEIMKKLEEQVEEQRKRDRDDAEFRGYMKRSLQDVTDVVTVHGKRLDVVESEGRETRRIAEAAARNGELAEARFGQRVDVALGSLKTEMAGRLGAQDAEIAAIKEQTRGFGDLRDYVVGSKATMGFLKWAILAIPVIVAIVLGIAHYAALTSTQAHPAPAAAHHTSEPEQ